MANLTDERGITRARRQLLAGMSMTRAQQARELLRQHRGHLGPNPDQLILGLLAVILLVVIALALLGALGQT